MCVTGVTLGSGGARRDSLERAAAAGGAFSPGALEQYARGKWVSGAPLSPPLGAQAGLQRLVSAAPGAEAAKYRSVSNQPTVPSRNL